MNRQKLIESVTKNEEYVAQPYKDSKGLWTFGIGRCLETNPLKFDEWRYLLESGQLRVVITEEGAQWLRDKELADGEMILGSFFFPHWNEFSDARRNVLVEMVYQMGWTRFHGFRKMIKAIESKNWALAAMEGLDSKWAREDSPARAKRLMSQLERGEFV